MTSIAHPVLSRIFRSVLIAATFLAVVACTARESEQDEKTHWKISMVKYEDLEQTDLAEAGFCAGLGDEGLVEDVDYSIVVRSAQGDLPTILTILGATAVDGTDMLVSLQTPTLHSAVSKGSGVPLLFIVVANPHVIAAVGPSDSSHLPWVTGIYTNTTFSDMMGYIRQCLPFARRIGTLYSSSELNSVYYRTQLMNAAAAENLEVEARGVMSKEAVKQATEALCAKDIDAICQLEDNLTSAMFRDIIEAAKKHKKPVFSFVNRQAELGSVIVYAPDYYRAGYDAAGIAARIIRGESPADIPFERIKKFDMIVNMNAARDFGIVVPEEIRLKADRIIDDLAP